MLGFDSGGRILTILCMALCTRYLTVKTLTLNYEGLVDTKSSKTKNMHFSMYQVPVINEF